MAGSKNKGAAKSAGDRKGDCCKGADGPCCSVGAIMTVDPKGQILLPKDLRKKSGIAAGQKLAAICVEKAGRACCIMLVKADELNDIVRVRVAPALGELKE